jgi:hypothetical protein
MGSIMVRWEMFLIYIQMGMAKFVRSMSRIMSNLAIPRLGFHERLYFCTGIKKLKNYQPSKSLSRWSNDADDQSQKLRK